MHRPVPIDDVPSSSHQLGSSCFTAASFHVSADFNALHITLVPACKTYVTCPRATALLSWIQLCPPAGLTSAHRLHIMHHLIWCAAICSKLLSCVTPILYVPMSQRQFHYMILSVGVQAVIHCRLVSVAFNRKDVPALSVNVLI